MSSEQARAEKALALVYDTHQVLEELRTDKKAAARTSLENLCDVLDAMSRIIKRSPTADSGAEEWCVWENIAARDWITGCHRSAGGYPNSGTCKFCGKPIREA